MRYRFALFLTLAVLSACSLLLSLGATAPATATEQPSTLDDVTAASKNRAVDTTKTSLHHGEGQRPYDLDVAHAADTSVSEGTGTGRTDSQCRMNRSRSRAETSAFAYSVVRKNRLLAQLNSSVSLPSIRRLRIGLPDLRAAS